jgi:hypothetical protein
MNTNPINQHNKGEVFNFLPPKVKSQLYTFNPVGTAITIVAAVK